MELHALLMDGGALRRLNSGELAKLASPFPSRIGRSVFALTDTKRRKIQRRMPNAECRRAGFLFRRRDQIDDVNNLGDGNWC